MTLPANGTHGTVVSSPTRMTERGGGTLAQPLGSWGDHGSLLRTNGRLRRTSANQWTHVPPESAMQAESAEVIRW